MKDASIDGVDGGGGGGHGASLAESAA